MLLLLVIGIILQDYFSFKSVHLLLYIQKVLKHMYLTFVGNEIIIGNVFLFWLKTYHANLNLRLCLWCLDGIFG